jgi:hypothetical protein
MGDITLKHGVAVDLKLMNGAGRPLHEGWTLASDRPLKKPSLRSGLILEFQGFNPVGRLGPDGLRLPALEAGRRLFHLAHATGAHAELEFEVPEWSPDLGVVEARATYTGPDLEGLRVISFKFFGSLQLPANSPLAPTEIEVLGPTGPLPLWIGFDPASALPAAEARLAGPAERAPKSLPSGPFSRRVEALFVRHSGPEVLELTISDPRFIPQVLALGPAGEAITVELEGNSSLVLEVVDAQSGAAIPDFAVTRHHGPSSTTLHGPWTPEHRSTHQSSRRVIRGLLTDAQTITVGAEGYKDQVVQLEAIAPGGTRRVRVEL